MKPTQVELTARELQVLACAARGLSMRETGTELVLAYQTVLSHRKRILAKLKARNITHAVTIGLLGGQLVHLGLLAPPPPPKPPPDDRSWADGYLSDMAGADAG